MVTAEESGSLMTTSRENRRVLIAMSRPSKDWRFDRFSYMFSGIHYELLPYGLVVVK